MKDLHILCGIFGNIYIAKKLKEDGVMSSDRVEATSEAVNAVANHLQCKPEFRDRGYAGYVFKCGEQNVRLIFFDSDKYELKKKGEKHE